MKKILAVLCVLLVTFGCLYAGGSSEKKSSDGKTVLEVWGWNDDQACLEEVVAAYEALHPEIDINLTIAPVREYDDKLVTTLAGNGDIDVMCINGNAPYSQLVSRHQLMPLDDFIAADGFDTSVYGSTFDTYKYEGTTYSIPYRASVLVLCYNKDIFDEQGVPYPTDDMTWEEVFELAKQVTNVRPDGQTQYGICLYTRNMDWMMPAYQSGWTYLDEDMSLIRYGLEYKMAAMEAGISMPHGEIKSVGTGIRALFEDESMAMYITGDWTVNQMRQSAANGTIDFDWDFVAMPHMEGAPAYNTEVQTVHTAINAKSEHPEEAWDFLSFLAGVEGAKIFAKNGTMPGAVYSEEVAAAYRGDGSLPPENVDCLFNQTLHDPLAISDNLKAIDTIFLEESELVFVGDQSIDEAIENIVSRRAPYL